MVYVYVFMSKIYVHTCMYIYNVFIERDMQFLYNHEPYLLGESISDLLRLTKLEVNSATFKIQNMKHINMSNDLKFIELKGRSNKTLREAATTSEPGASFMNCCTA